MPEFHSVYAGDQKHPEIREGKVSESSCARGFGTFAGRDFLMA